MLLSTSTPLNLMEGVEGGVYSVVSTNGDMIT